MPRRSVSVIGRCPAWALNATCLDARQENTVPINGRRDVIPAQPLAAVGGKPAQVSCGIYSAGLWEEGGFVGGRLCGVQSPASTRALGEMMGNYCFAYVVRIDSYDCLTVT
jgi:hypothetical protein